MRALVIISIVTAIGCGPGNRKNGPCSAGETHCEGLTFQTCVDGKFVDTQDCDQACSDGIGCHDVQGRRGDLQRQHGACL
jgi:hypothetical protein